VSQLSSKGCDWCGDSIEQGCVVCKTCEDHCCAPREHGLVDMWWERPMPKDMDTEEGIELWADAVFRTSRS
jgi:hypothetical protein